MNLEKINIKKILEETNIKITSKDKSLEDIIDDIKFLKDKYSKYMINENGIYLDIFELRNYIFDLIEKDSFYIKTYKEFLIDEFNDLSDDELLNIAQELDEYLYIYDDTDEDFFKNNFSDIDEAVRAVCYGDYEYMAPYVRFNGYGNLETTWNLRDFIYADDLADIAMDIDYKKDKYNEYLDETFDYLYNKIHYSYKGKLEDLKEKLDSYKSDDPYQEGVIDDLVIEIEERMEK